MDLKYRQDFIVCCNKFWNVSSILLSDGVFLILSVVLHCNGKILWRSTRQKQDYKWPEGNTMSRFKSFRYVCVFESCLKSIYSSWEQFSSGEEVSVHKLEQFCVGNLCSWVYDPANVENSFH